MLGACVALASLLVPAPRAHAQRIHTIARVIATGNVDGRFAHPVCDRGESLRASDNAAFTYALSRSARDTDRPLIIDTGGLLSPHGVARYAAEHRPNSLAWMVHDLGYRALALGMNDLAAPREGLLRTVRQLRRRGVPMLASNLRCTEEAAELCALLVDGSDGPSMHTVNGRLTAVIAVLRPNATELIAPDRARGIAFDPPAESIARLTRIAHEQGAELVVAVVDGQIEGGPIQLAGALPEDARPNLVLVSDYDELLFARPRTVRPVLVGTSFDDAVEVLIRESEELRSEGYEMLAQPLGGRGVTVAEPVRTWMERIGRDYCEAWGRPLEGGSLETPIDVPQMLEMVAGIVRERAGADVAIINRQSLDRHWQPARSGSLTASDVFIAIEHDEPLQAAEVDHAWLTQVARTAATGGNLATPGLTWTNDGATIEVGGHPVESRARYRVVTIRFLAAGGDGALPPLPAGATWQDIADATLRTEVLDYLETPRAVDPRAALPDPEGTVEWVFRADAALVFSGAGADNPPRRCTNETPPANCVDGFQVDDAGAPVSTYGTTQLTQSDVLTFGLQVDLAANASAPDWTWQNTGSFLYRTTWTEPAAGSSGDFIEAADQIRARSSLSWRGLRQGNDQFYIPDPTVDLFVESELTNPAERDWHWFLTRPSVGLRFQLLDKLQLQAIVGFEVQPFDPEVEVEPGIGGTLTLAPWDIMRVGSQYTRLAFTFDYFLADLGDQERGALRGQIDASFDLAGPLALTLRFNVLVQHEAGQDIGAAINAVAGLQLGYLGRAVGP